MSSAWRNQLRPASFRGVPFEVDSSERGGGRRTAKHEFPGKNTGYNEDLGRKLNDYPLQGFVIDPNYFPLRDALVTALEADGPGTLVHPYFGTIQVVCTGWRVRETKDEGGMAIFTLTFEEAGSLSYPAATANTSSQIAAASAGVLTAAQTALQSGLVTGALSKSQSVLNSITGVVSDAVNNAKADYRAVAQVAFQLNNMQAQITNALNSPALIAQIMNSTMGLFNGLGLSSSDTTKGFLGLMTVGSSIPAIVATTTAKSQEMQNQTAIIAAAQQMAIANAASSAVQTPFTSYDDATSVRDQISSAIDSQLESVTDDNLFLALTELQTQVTLALPPPGQTLGSIATLTPNITTCSLVFLFENFGSIAMEPDFLSRNDISNPFFLAANQPLKVLQNAGG